MFTKLRNRFLIVNLVIISVVMLIAFASIYVITYRNVQADINDEIHRVADFYQKPSGGSDSSPSGRHKGDSPSAPMDNGAIDNGSMDSGPMNNGDSRPDRSVAFSLKTDAEWNITSTTSPFEMDSDFYVAAVQEASAVTKNTGQFSLDGSHWAFLKQQTNEGYNLVFLDVTAQQDILTNLIYTFSVVGLAMLIILFFTSRFFANQSIRPVKEAFDKQKQFIADASHEMKTPLTIINTNTDVLLSNSEDTIHNQAKWLHYIKSETERMTKLTNDLLYLTEMDDARTSMVYSKFNMSDAVENIILTMEAVIFEKNVSLDYDIEPDLMVQGSGEQIKQVVMILLDNAVKYTSAKGTVTMSLQKQQNDIVLAVTNTGEGIAAEHLTRIFDRFYRTDSSRARKQGGYGLGLAIAKSIVDQHKGKIYAKSTVGESTSFYVHLS
ncbi:two-component sensor histidine kinase [Paenibacillus sp. BIHB 4019]|uniref:histidine kinase n=1 Tax=Paenibacillus sp. BIHB 4019 TaxID=1870819 RepID=A0A1B2DDH3_9BACL|nr:HAMP domain-containing sensor histidine kinase [Paenibacillus sp. BIHB 4019]ANY65762.1 two-component sensor histidine kinase [Paenibacillus sp. BIHB 4019]